MGNCFSTPTAAPENPNSFIRVHDITLPTHRDSHLSASDLLLYINSRIVGKQGPYGDMWMTYKRAISNFIHFPNSFPFLPFFLFSKIPLYYEEQKPDTDVEVSKQDLTASPEAFHCLCMTTSICVSCFIEKCLHVQNNAIRTKKVNDKDLEAVFGPKDSIPISLWESACVLVLSFKRSRTPRDLINLFCESLFDLVIPRKEYFQGFISTFSSDIPELLHHKNPEIFVPHLEQRLRDYLEGGKVTNSVVLSKDLCFRLLKAFAVYYNLCTKVLHKAFVPFRSPFSDFECGKCSVCHGSSSTLLPLLRLHVSQNHSVCMFCCVYLAKLSWTRCPFCDEKVDYKESLSRRGMVLSDTGISLVYQDFPSYLHLLSGFLPSVRDSFISKYLGLNSFVRNCSLTLFSAKVTSSSKVVSCSPFSLTSNYQRVIPDNFLSGLFVAKSCVSQYLSEEDIKCLDSFINHCRRIEDTNSFIDHFNVNSGELYLYLFSFLSILSLLDGQNMPKSEVLDVYFCNLYSFSVHVSGDVNIGLLLHMLLFVLNSPHLQALHSQFFFMTFCHNTVRV
ncbi:hypothetical protein RCL1_002672 [Eukaryota sp. TZLM3-RCL]